jgi:hypothetical protein
MKKFLLLGVVAVLLSFGLVLMSCGNKCPGGGSTVSKGDCKFAEFRVCSKACVNLLSISDRCKC